VRRITFVISNWVNNKYEFSAMGKSKTFEKIMAVSKKTEFTNRHHLTDQT
jgi:hypothetical protein